jgi:Cellulase (glycosyl hydrolase family 5)
VLSLGVRLSTRILAVPCRVPIIIVALFVIVAVVPGRGAAADALHVRALGDLRAFAEWLGSGPGEARHGIIGEVGWPDDDVRWNELASRWYAQAGRAGLWVAAWSAGELWASSYKLLIYGTGSSGLPSASQATVVESQDDERRGINVAGAEFASPVEEPRSSFSNENPGRYGVDYAYPTQEFLNALAARGMTFIRLPFRWERVQPLPDGPLNSSEIDRLTAAVSRAGNAGMDVVLDVHNYGAYYLAEGGRGVRRAIGSPELGIGAFADLWQRLSQRFVDDPTVIGYGLMNEPTGMAGAEVWERASLAAAAAVRGSGDETRLLVQSYDWGGTRQFAANHPNGPWIGDPNVWYEAHQYFDSDRSARYAATYDREVWLAQRAR